MKKSDKYRFNVEFLEEALKFLEDLDVKTREKVLENIRISRFKRDPKLLKKINKEIWEYRTKFNTKQIRLLAFWDKEAKALIICTHGFIKKTQKVPTKEIERARKLKANYLIQKNRK